MKAGFLEAALVCIAVLSPALAGPAQADSAATQPAAAGGGGAVADNDPRTTPVVRAYQKVRPAVVNIATERIVNARMGFGGMGGGLDAFDDIFPSPFVRRVPMQTLGSGFVVHPGGYIITNAHVVRRAEKVDVIFPDKSKYPAKIVSASQQYDLAVLKIEPNDGRALPYLPLGRSDDLMVGEPAIAVGNPMGYSNTVSVGIISGTGRDLEFEGGVKIAGLIQTDAPINPGNSGGPLLNIKGELIGITTAIRADAQNIGFAIPVDTLAAELGDLLDFERINRVIFGAAVSQRHGPSGPEVYVSAVRASTPAQKIGLAKGDRIVSLDGTKISQIPDFACAMITAKPGGKVHLAVERGREGLEFDLVLQGKPKPSGKTLARRLLGMTLRAVTPEVAKDMRLPVDRGLVVVGMDAKGPAAELGVQLKDVLIQVERLYVTDLDELGTVLEDVKGGAVLNTCIIRGNIRFITGFPTRKDGDAASSPEDVPTTAPAETPSNGGAI